LSVYPRNAFLLHSAFDWLPYLLSSHLSLLLHDLQSFPTRRSSDLVYGVLGLILQAVLGFFGVIVPLWVAVGIVFLIGALMPSGRSEEHTSELQSRFDLVCRLLLEKKKDRDQQPVDTHLQQPVQHHP